MLLQWKLAVPLLGSIFLWTLLDICKVLFQKMLTGCGLLALESTFLRLSFAASVRALVSLELFMNLI